MEWRVGKTTLSEARCKLSSSSIEDLAFFGGGVGKNGVSNVVDIFNSTTQTWSKTTLSEGRYFLSSSSSSSSSSIGEMVVVFGGGVLDVITSKSSSTVDIYNVESQSWITTTLSQPRYELASASSRNKIFFGGGFDGSQFSDIVDIVEIPFSKSTLNVLYSDENQNQVEETSNEYDYTLKMLFQS
jgi:hypothetical protein